MSLLMLLLASARAEPITITDDGDSVRAVRWARPFELVAADTDRMRAEQAPYTEGTIVELLVDPAMVVPAQTLVPVLYVGDRPARPLNWDPVGGCLVALVTGPVDLATTPVFFGSTELPERVDATRGAAELAAARAIGIGPLPADQVRAALAAGGAPLVADIRDVYAAAADRIEACSPSEGERARNLRVR